MSLLKQVYKMTLDEDFTYDSFDKRLKLQKIVYLLECLGVNVGNYGFSWYKHGPYSQELQNDAYYTSHASMSSTDVGLTEDAKEKIALLKGYISECKGTEYSESYWLETIASLYYLKYRMKVKPDMLLVRLTEEKKHLKKENLNERALEIIDKINAEVA